MIMSDEIKMAKVTTDPVRIMRVSGNGQSIADLAADVAQLQDDVAGIQDDVAGIQEDVTQLQTDVSGVSSTVSEMASDVSEIAADVGDLKSAVSGITEIKSKITYTNGYYYWTNVDIGATVSITEVSDASWESVIIDCNSGDKFKIYAYGAGARAWAFLDADNILLAKSEAGLVDKTVTAPVNAAKVVLNNKTSETTSNSYTVVGTDAVGNLSMLIAPTEASYKATQAYASGALFIVNDILYKATASIANGATITPGTNCISTTLAAVIAALG